MLRAHTLFEEGVMLCVQESCVCVGMLWRRSLICYQHHRWAERVCQLTFHFLSAGERWICGDTVIHPIVIHEEVNTCVFMLTATTFNPNYFLCVITFNVTKKNRFNFPFSTHLLSGNWCDAPSCCDLQTLPGVYRGKHAQGTACEKWTSSITDPYILRRRLC